MCWLDEVVVVVVCGSGIIRQVFILSYTVCTILAFSLILFMIINTECTMY